MGKLTAQRIIICLGLLICGTCLLWITLNENADRSEAVTAKQVLTTIITVTVKNNKININRANKDELMSLPEIGEAKAEEIIRYRNDHGDFSDIEQITDVYGIGEQIFENIKNQICV